MAGASAGPVVAAARSDAGSNLLARVAPLDWAVAADWRPLVDRFFDSDAGRTLCDFLRERLQRGATIYPALPLRALESTPLAAVRVVILGQDPYHGAGQAEGLAFSVPDGVAAPPSLRNIHKELGRDLGLPATTRPNRNSLVPWARQGVLLLNACLTVEEGQPASHAQRGWETLTDQILAAVAGRPRPCAYLLWGMHAQSKAQLIEKAANRHDGAALILRANHPSPLSANRGPLPFIGCGHFSAASQWLAQRDAAIDWHELD